MDDHSGTPEMYGPDEHLKSVILNDLPGNDFNLILLQCNFSACVS
jgi:hypothetical protein